MQMYLRTIILLIPLKHYIYGLIVMSLKLLSLNEAKMEYNAYSVSLKFQNDFAAFFLFQSLKTSIQLIPLFVKL